MVPLEPVDPDGYLVRRDGERAFFFVVFDAPPDELPAFLDGAGFFAGITRPPVIGGYPNPARARVSVQARRSARGGTPAGYDWRGRRTGALYTWGRCRVAT